MLPYATHQLLEEPHDFRIPRKGDRDLAFRGWFLSHAAERSGSFGVTRGVDVDIYATVGVRFVAHVCRWSLRDGEGLREDHRVAVRDSATQLVEWLKQENTGRLDAASKRAWVRACHAWPGLEREAVERVD